MTSNEIVDKLKILADGLNLDVIESNNSLTMYIHNEGFSVLHFDKLRTQIWFEVRNEIHIKMNTSGPTIFVGDVYLVCEFNVACLLVRTFVFEYKKIHESIKLLKNNMRLN